MVDIRQVDDILKEVNANPNVITSLVILKSGMLVAGKPPAEVNLETFVVMASLLISAAESATSGFKGKFEIVFVELDSSRIIIVSAGTKGALVVVTKTKDNHDSLDAQIKKATLNLASVL